MPANEYSKRRGVYGDIVAGEFPLGFIPFDYDLLSLEQGSAFRVRHLFYSMAIGSPAAETFPQLVKGWRLHAFFVLWSPDSVTSSRPHFNQGMKQTVRILHMRTMLSMCAPKTCYPGGSHGISQCCI